MSRTDAHAPLRVRLVRGELAMDAFHAADHNTCDLPAHPPYEGGRAGRQATRCYWVFRYTGTNVCACWMCHGGVEGRRQNRRERHYSRTALDDVRRIWNSEDPDAGWDA